MLKSPFLNILNCKLEGNARYLSENCWWWWSSKNGGCTYVHATLFFLCVCMPPSIIINQNGVSGGVNYFFFTLNIFKKYLKYVSPHPFSAKHLLFPSNFQFFLHKVCIRFGLFLLKPKNMMLLILIYFGIEYLIYGWLKVQTNWVECWTVRSASQLWHLIIFQFYKNLNFCPK
jgi:hypothetical protein